MAYTTSEAYKGVDVVGGPTLEQMQLEVSTFQEVSVLLVRHIVESML